MQLCLHLPIIFPHHLNFTSDTLNEIEREMKQIFIFLPELIADITPILSARKNHTSGIGLRVLPVKHLDEGISKRIWE